MTDRVETLLRQAMADEAGRAPNPGDLAGDAHRRVARRRRTMVESLGAVAVVVAVLAGVVIVAVNRAPADPGVAPDPVGSPAEPTPSTAPPGTRLVGIGHVAIAVPQDWGTNELHCGTPTANTVILDVAAIEACIAPYPDGVDSAGPWQGKPKFDFVADETVEIDGVSAQRQRTTCQSIPQPAPVGTDADDVTVCSGALYLPSLKVGVSASSSTSAERVDEILGWVRMVSDAVGVPGYQVISSRSPQEQYVAALTEAGLAYEIRTEKRPAMPAGFVLGVSPAPGTMVAPGSTVTVTVVGR